MVDVANEPAVVLICVVLAAALIVAEAGLPTFGLAGLLGFIMIGVAVVGINDADLEWWPLALTAVAVCLWCVQIARRVTSSTQQIVAVALFTFGSVYFGILAEDALTIVISLVGGAVLALGFPMLFERSSRLMNAPSSTGMDGLVNQTAVVSAWAGTEGTVVLEGSFWNARGPSDLAEGDGVVVSGYEGMTLTVRPAAPEPGDVPMTVPKKETN